MCVYTEGLIVFHRLCKNKQTGCQVPPSVVFFAAVGSNRNEGVAMVLKISLRGP
jgi:hypothetical protein